jgi:hypothetical protein
MDRERERPVVPPEERSIFEVENIADVIFEMNRNMPKSRIPTLSLGW